MNCLRPDVVLELDGSVPPPVPGLGPLATGALIAVLAVHGSVAARRRARAAKSEPFPRSWKSRLSPDWS